MHVSNQYILTLLSYAKVIIFVQKCMFQTNTFSHFSLMPRLLSLYNNACFKSIISHYSLTPRLLSLYNNACFNPIHSHITLLCQGYYLCTTMHVSNQYILTLLSSAKVIVFVQQCMFQTNTFSHYSLMPRLLSLYNNACFKPIHSHITLLCQGYYLCTTMRVSNQYTMHVSNQYILTLLSYAKVIIFVQQCMFQTNTFSHYSLMCRLFSLYNNACFKPIHSHITLLCQGYYLCTTMHVSNQYILTLLSYAKVIIFVQQCMFQTNTFSHYSLMPRLLSLYNNACFNLIHFHITL